MKKILSIFSLIALCAGISILSGCQQGGKVIKIAMLPKFKGENYFDACKKGAEEAVAEINKNGKVVDFIYDGPAQDQASNQKQVDILEGWIAQKVNVIIVSPNDPVAIAPTLKKAQEKGIKVLTYDADAQTDSRDLFINQVVSAGVAEGLVKSAADKLMEKGYGPNKSVNVALISQAKTDANQQAWLSEIKKLLAGQYSWMIIRNEDTDIYYPGPDETKTQIDAGTLISRMGPNSNQIQAGIALTSMAAPALGSQYQSAANKPDKNAVALTGLGTPNALKSYIKDETNPMSTGVLWNCMDLGYLAVMAGYQMATGEITSVSAKLTAGRLGSRKIEDKMIVLGPALIFDSVNVDQFNY